MEIALFCILHETFLRVTNLILSSLTLENFMKNCAAFSFSYRMEILMTTYK